MALLLRLKTTRPKTTNTLTNPPSLHHLFSTSNTGGDGGDKPPSDSIPSFSFSDSFRDLKSSLKQKPTSKPVSSLLSSSNPQEHSLSGEIMKNIQGFRNRTAVPIPENQKKPISFQEIYSKIQNRPGESAGNTSSKPSKSPGGGIGEGNFDAIRGSLSQLKGTIANPSLPKWRPSPSSKVIGGTNPLPESVFGKEARERISRELGGSANLLNLPVRSYMHNELGEKLKKLRPQVKGKEWFSIAELNERLMKVREMDEIEAKSKSDLGSVLNSCLSSSLAYIQNQEEDNSKKASMQRIDMLSLMGGTPTYLTKPPKEHLVEKYFHPDNMSSAEKLKIELTKVRDEFKMSESDCGSARVQGTCHGINTNH
ncbi:uncharacterized protein [Cicer arietinum]|uniref:Uncharacterized protein LOC101488736 isoform X2 n=1 Tax=Cicer arietinum TaxID=3827 RepID=A0A3Q7YBM1_CICAR|nr:uncharacterized protein LOC101488736 isoform X2 [Cicer arietinum]